MANINNIVVDQGTSFEMIIDVDNTDGTAFNLTNMIPRGQFRKSYYSDDAHEILVSVYGDVTNGQLQMIISPDITENIRSGRYVYDIIIENVSINFVRRIVQGVITIPPAVTSLTL